MRRTQIGSGHTSPAGTRAAGPPRPAETQNGHCPGTTRIPCSWQNARAFALTEPLPVARYIQTRRMPASAQSCTTVSVASGEVISSTLRREAGRLARARSIVVPAPLAGWDSREQRHTRGDRVIHGGPLDSSQFLRASITDWQSPLVRHSGLNGAAHECARPARRPSPAAPNLSQALFDNLRRLALAFDQKLAPFPRFQGFSVLN